MAVRLVKNGIKLSEKKLLHTRLMSYQLFVGMN
jgi:hypothetical protein